MFRFGGLGVWEVRGFRVATGGDASQRVVLRTLSLSIPPGPSTAAHLDEDGFENRSKDSCEEGHHDEPLGPKFASRRAKKIPSTDPPFFPP